MNDKHDGTKWKSIAQQSMDLLFLTRLQPIMKLSNGDPNIAIGVIDGPVNLSHPDFRESKIRTVKDSQFIACKNASSIACIHGTFITGILAAKRDGNAPAICPNCQIILYPIFKDNAVTNINFNNNNNIVNTDGIIIFPTSTPKELSNAIIQTIDAGAKIINLSLELSSSSLVTFAEIEEAYDYACQNDVIIVAASGDQGNVGSFPLLNHPWVIPVAACDDNGFPLCQSNFGPSIANRGLMAPGVNVTSTSSTGQYIHISGTSVAAPFVTGTIALLWSLFPNASTSQIVYSIKRSSNTIRRRTIIPPLLNSEKAYEVLKKMII